MLRIVLMIVAAIFLIFVAAAVVRTLFWLALIVLIVGAAGVAFGAIKFGHRPERRPRGSRR